MMANQLEIFRATVEHREHDGTLFYANFTPYLENKIREIYGINKDESLRHYFGMYTPVEVSLKSPKGFKEPDFSRYFSDIEILKGSFINHLGVLEVPGSMYHFTGYISPLRNATTLKEIEDFSYPNVEGFTEEHMKGAVEKAHMEGRVTCCGLTHMYEDAWQIRGYTQFLEDMILEPEICEYVLDQIMERNMKKAEAAARAGVDVLISGDDVANQRDLMFSPDQWRRFMKSRWAKVYEAARRIKPDIQIWYHSDGNIESIIPELIDIGVTILNPIQPECMNPLLLKRKYGKYLVLDGTIGTQTTMPFGTAAEIKQIINERKKQLGTDGALILSPTHVLEPEVPIENVVAFIEACSNVGLRP